MSPPPVSSAVTAGQLSALQLELAMALTESQRPAEIVRAFLQVLMRTLSCRRGSFLHREHKDAAGWEVTIPRVATSLAADAPDALVHGLRRWRDSGQLEAQGPLHHALDEGWLNVIPCGDRGLILLETTHFPFAPAVHAAVLPLAQRLIVVLQTTLASQQLVQAQLIEHRAAQQHALLALTTALSEARGDEALLEAMRRHLQKTVDTALVTFMEFDAERDQAVCHVIAARDEGPQRQLADGCKEAAPDGREHLERLLRTLPPAERARSACMRVLQSGRALDSRDYRTDTFSDWEILGAHAPGMTLFSLPLVLGDEAFGVLTLGLQADEAGISDGLPWWNQVASVLSAHISAHRARTRLDDLNSQLEERIAQRTLELDASLQESRTLLREIHHRVKNNLQIISSLLMMQSRNLPDPALRRTIEESVHRVRSIALLHEFLYGTGSLSHVDLARYLERLSAFLRGAIAPGSQVRIDAEPVRVRLETAVPFGLVINELLTNALKYGSRSAAAQGASGAAVPSRIEVRLYQHEDGRRLVLSVSDNGPGLPPDFDPSRTKGLGLSLVAALSRQLRGTLRAWSDGGAHFEFGFEPEQT